MHSNEANLHPEWRIVVGMVDTDQRVRIDEPQIHRRYTDFLRERVSDLREQGRNERAWRNGIKSEVAPKGPSLPLSHTSRTARPSGMLTLSTTEASKFCKLGVPVT